MDNGELANASAGAAAGTGAKIGAWAWEKREEIANSLNKLYKWFRGKKKDAGGPISEPGEPEKSILIIGPGGVGKSTLGAFLSGEFDLIHKPPGEYRETLDTERIPFSPDEETSTTLIIPPGQEHRRASSWTELYAGIARGEFRGIILIAAYGYHSLGSISYKEHRLFPKNTRTPTKFVELFRADRLAEELKVLKGLAPDIIANRQKMWFVSLVTKQDLWWDEAPKVREHYEASDWATELAKLSHGKLPEQFRSEIVYASLVINNYRTGQGELLKKNCAGYDHSEYVASLRNIIEVLDGLRKWEG